MGKRGGVGVERMGGVRGGWVEGYNELMDAGDGEVGSADHNLTDWIGYGIKIGRVDLILYYNNE